MFHSFSPDNKHEQGFTLIELLVVIIIIGILAAIAIPLFLDQRKLAVDASVKSDVRNTLANIKTWQANDANANKAIANTGDFISATNGGKVAQSPGNSIGISISSTGDATVCGYNASGKTYTVDTASGSNGAYVFSPATGQFTTGSCVANSTTGGTASTGSSSGGSSGGGSTNVGAAVVNLTMENDDPYNSSWSYAKASGGYLGSRDTYKPRTGQVSQSLYQGGTDTFTDTTVFVPGQTYKVTAWIYNYGNTNYGIETDIDALNTSSGTVSTSVVGGYSGFDGAWQQATLTFTATSTTSLRFRYYASSTTARAYIDDMVITRQ